MLRSLSHYWRIQLAVAAAVAVCAAVLTGALLVGDSVRGSLRDLTLDRLGHVDLALAADRFFRQELVTELEDGDGFAEAGDAAVPVILLRGSVELAGTGTRASLVNVLGVDGEFMELFREPPVSATFSRNAGPAPTSLELEPEPRQIFPPVAVNATLAEELGAEPGDQILIRFQLGSSIPRDTLLGKRDATEVLGTLRATIRQVVPDRGPGRFDLAPHQGFPRNAFLRLEELQEALEQPGRINGILVARRGGGDDPAPALGPIVDLEDLGLEVRTVDSGGPSPVAQVESEEFVLRPRVREAVEAAATELGASILPLQAYLANRLRIDNRTVPYSMVLALDPPVPDPALGRLRLVDGGPVPALGPREVLLNAWTAEQLDAEIGDELEMTYYVVGPDEELDTRSTSFTVAGVVAMDGLAVDPAVTPDYPGIEGVDNMADWDPPFPVDLGLVRPVDEAYWDEYRAAPKAFVALDTGRELWSTRYGAITAVRVAPPTGSGAAELSDELAAGIRDRLDPESFGFRFLPVKRQGLEASTGATDFGGLFIGFSFFLIVSAILIVGLLFSLGIRQRAREVGLLQAVGYRRQRVRNRLLAEGALVAALGAAAGLVGAVLYGRLLILGLTTIWLPAVGSPLLFLYVEPSTLALGWTLAVVVALASIGWSLRSLRKVPVTGLLKGSFRTSGRSRGRRRRRHRWIALGATATGLAFLGYGLATGAASDPVLAFLIGAALLVAGIAAFAAWCQGSRGHLRRAGTAAAVAMAARNSGWSPSRSILSVALVASACFLIVVVAGNTRDPESESETVAEGAGGYSLVATTAVPVYGDLDDPTDRLDLGIDEETAELLADLDVAQLRLLPGDDASCLNLYRPQRPRLLGVPPSFRERGGFRFGARIDHPGDDPRSPWELLELDLGPGVIPAIGDANSTQWILHLGLGDELEMENERGESIRLRIVAMLRESVFQSELLIAEEAFLEHFPGRSGFGYFLIDAPEDEVDAIASALEEGLGELGFDAVSAARKLAGFLVVQNTYLSTFLMLGGLGLLLGTVGLAIVLVRNVLERRGELATLRAFGFRRGFLAWMVLAENAFLLAVGAAVGTVSAMAAISPRYLLGVVEIPWMTLVPTLAAVLLVGMTAGAVAVSAALRVPLVPALKSEG